MIQDGFQFFEPVGSRLRGSLSPQRLSSQTATAISTKDYELVKTKYVVELGAMVQQSEAGLHESLIRPLCMLSGNVHVVATIRQPRTKQSCTLYTALHVLGCAAP